MTENGFLQPYPATLSAPPSPDEFTQWWDEMANRFAVWNEIIAVPAA
jgi:hypothetical protein